LTWKKSGGHFEGMQVLLCKILKSEKKELLCHISYFEIRSFIWEVCRLNLQLGLQFFSISAGQSIISYKLRVPGVARVKFEAQKMYLIWLKINMRNS